jgi:hypothetical protein
MVQTVAKKCELLFCPAQYTRVALIQTDLQVSGGWSDGQPSPIGSLLPSCPILASLPAYGRSSKGL